jgi:VanZ family protein
VKKRLSNFTLAWGVYLVVSAAFMLQLRCWLFKIFGDFFIVNFLRLIFLLLSFFVLLYAWKREFGFLRLAGIFFLFGLAYFLSSVQPYFAEKTHLVSYGLLGYLAARDLLTIGKKGIFFALIFLVLISGLDEIFQFFLPYRVAEVRDFLTNISSGSLGMGLFCLIGPRQKITLMSERNSQENAGRKK